MSFTLTPPFSRQLMLVACSLWVGAAQAATVAAPPTVLASGLDPTGQDSAVRVQDDLFNAVNGQWVKTTEIPADKSSYGTFLSLRDLSDQRVRTIVEELATQPQAAGSVQAKVADFYRSFTDTAAIDQAGLAPLQPLLTSIEAIQTREALATWLGQAQGVVDGPLALYVSGDAKNPGRNLATVDQSGLGLPDRDYYLKQDDERMAAARAAYLGYLTQLGNLSGDAEAAGHAAQALALETQLAQLHWARQDLRDPLKTYNPTAVADLSSAAPGLDWARLLSAAQLGAAQQLSIGQPSAVAGTAKLLAELPLAQWRAYLRLRTLDATARSLPQPLRDAHFAFHGTALTGAKQALPRWQQGVSAVGRALGEAVGQIYVALYFPPASKARMQQLVGNLLEAYRDSIGKLSWMSEATKLQALDKLAHYTTKIGYPDRWRDYSALEVKSGDALGNDLRAGRFAWARIAARAGQPVDRTEWGMTPQTVNAYYNASLNEIVFPAAILQPPFFDMAADDAVNYGAIGAIIGHEISHGFDDEGSRFDGEGRLRDWWTDADRKAFDAITARLVNQYSAYQVLPGKPLNGKLTLGENIADLSGLQISYKAYAHSLQGQKAPIIGGYTGEQRFFLGWAQGWRSKTREQRELQLLTVDPHSPGRFRADGAAVNVDAFHEAFGTRPGDGMFKPPAERIRLW